MVDQEKDINRILVETGVKMFTDRAFPRHYLENKDYERVGRETDLEEINKDSERVGEEDNTLRNIYLDQLEKFRNLGYHVEYYNRTTNLMELRFQIEVLREKMIKKIKYGLTECAMMLIDMLDDKQDELKKNK